MLGPRKSPLREVGPVSSYAARPCTTDSFHVNYLSLDLGVYIYLRSFINKRVLRVLCILSPSHTGQAPVESLWYLRLAQSPPEFISCEIVHEWVQATVQAG